jgi:DNA invertase Pin-like site-specific DNA recombinase
VKADQKITWGCYLRLSRRKPQRGRYRAPDESVERQLRLIRDYASEHGLDLPDTLVYRDNGRSAWRKPRRNGEPEPPAPERPGWEAMLADGRAGEFGGLLVWKLDRFARNVRDGEDLLDLAVLLDGPESGRIDLRKAHGRSEFRKQIEAAQHASDETSEKVRATFADMKASGYRIGGGGRLFGFEVLSAVPPGGNTPGTAAAVVREDEAGVIRELAGRLLAGETVQQMASDLNDRGITTTRGGQWAPRNLSRTLANPLYGGVLSYKGEPVADLANVDPILDKATYAAVQARLGARRRGRRASGRYPLSGVLECGSPACERRGTMAGHPRAGGVRAYVCPRAVGGCGQSVLAVPVEVMVRDRVLADLGDVAVREAMAAADDWLDAQRARLRQMLDDLDADLAETERKRAETPRTMARLLGQYSRNRATMMLRYEITERELAELGPASAPQEPLPALSAAEWDEDATPQEKASIIRRLHLRIVILPHTRRGRAFDRGRVLITEG